MLNAVKIKGTLSAKVSNEKNPKLIYVASINKEEERKKVTGVTEADVPSITGTFILKIFFTSFTLLPFN